MFETDLTRPKGPILGAKDEVAPISPPTARRQTKMKEKSIMKIEHADMFTQGLDIYVKHEIQRNL